jgi:hypothetical protein
MKNNSNTSPYMDSLINIFLNRVKQIDESENHPNWEGKKIYPKWISTLAVAEKLNVRVGVCRYNLNKIEKWGLVHSKRECNYIRWAANHIDGFEQHLFKDYYCRVF